jgi:non-homologous end joining protein Ku
MNERIRELAEQTTQEFSPAFERDKWQEKFAELIVKKCAMIGNYAHDGGEYPGPMIKEYFGVEE